MRLVREWLQRLTATVRPGRHDHDLEEELRLHLELAADAARRRGADPDEAQRLARIEAGGAPQAMEALRDQRGVPWLEDLARDARYGLRALGRSKGFAATALLSLALGIGATAGIFSLVDQVLFRPLAVADPERLVLVDWDWQGDVLGTEYGGGSLVSYPVCRELQDQVDVFDGVFCRHPTGVNLSSGRDHEPVSADVVSGSYFTVLGVRPALGRLIDPSDDLMPDAHPVVVVSYDYWRTRLGGAPDAVGRQVRINNYPMTVIGVAPDGFRGVDLDSVPAVWIPAMMKRQATPDWDRLLDRRAYWMHAFGRLEPGVTTAQARARLQPWFTALLDAETRAEDFPPVSDAQRGSFLASTLELLPAARGVSNLRFGLRQPLWVLMGGTLLLLLLASLNVAGLLLARGAARTRELTTRMALGATRGRVARQLLVESLLITLGGGALGVAIAPLVTRALRAFVAEGANLTSSVDRRVLLFAVLATAVTGALCALTPMLQTGRLRLSGSLTDRSGISRTGVRVRKLLVAGQVGFALVLLTAAGLFVQTLGRLQAKGPGFAPARLVMFGVNPTGLGYSYEESERAMREVFRRVQELPEVESASVANTRVLTGGTSTTVMTIQAEQRLVTDRLVHFMRVSPGFFSTLGAPLVAGREFDERDVRPPGTEPGPFRSIIVNETFARRYFGDRSPIGARIGRGTGPDVETDIEIIGVVREFSRRDLRDQEFEQAFFNYWDNQSDNGAFYVRVRGNPDASFAALRAAVSAVLPTHPVLSLTTVEDQIDRSLSSERALATLSSGFGALALLICLIGVYGVMAFVAAQRTQEIGMRLALGATRAAAAWVVVRDALVMIVAGTVLAVPAAWALRRLVESELFGIGAFDGPTISTAGGGLAIAALGAAAIPAWRAAMLPPMLAIQDQPESMWQTARRTVERAVRELAVAGDPSTASSAALVTEFSGLVHRSGSFAEAIDVALATLRDRVGARFVMLLERTGNAYAGDLGSIPVHGILLNRLTHYPHPLPLTPGELAAWRRWAAETRPEHLAEVDALDRAGVRMAVPLRAKSEIVGVLLLGAHGERDHYTAAERELLGHAADVFALLLENARLNDRALEQEKLRRDVALAAEVQRRLLPLQPPGTAAVALAAFTLPARSVGGDYYDFVDLPGERIGIAVADIAGKGIAAALLMSVVQASLRVIAADNEVGCAQLAAKMNRFLCRSTAATSYATFFYAQLDAGGGRLRYVNAGHNPPYLVRRTEAGVEVIELSAGGTVLGLFPDAPYEDAEVDLRAGDLVVAFTDGVTEARNADGEEFGEERLQQLLRDALGAPAETVSATLAARMRAWSEGAEQHDDLTFVVATVN